jgi:hypothetical protein
VDSNLPVWVYAIAGLGFALAAAVLFFRLR